MISVKCPGCNANLIYNIDKEMLVCEYCGGNYKSDDNRLLVDFFKDSKIMSARESTCPECGAKLLTDINTFSTNCIYCNASIVDNTKITEVFMPKEIILFEIDKETVKRNVKKLFKKNKLLIDDMILNEVKPIYLPYWLYDCVAEAQFNNKTVRVLGKGVLADASVKISDIFSDEVDSNFNLTKLKKFNVNMIAGHTAELYDVDFDNIYNRVNEKLRCAIDKRYKDVCQYTEIENYENYYILLPFYYLDVGEMQLLINGQNGVIASSDVMKKIEKNEKLENTILLWIFCLLTLPISLFVFFNEKLKNTFALFTLFSFLLCFLLIILLLIKEKIVKMIKGIEKTSISIKELR